MSDKKADLAKSDVEITDRGYERHPSYGLMSFSRGTFMGTKGQPLFGSEAYHSTVISMQVKRAERKRDLSHEWLHAYGLPIVEVEMSYSQFAEAITSMNQGEGIPVTLRYVEGDKTQTRPTPPPPTQKTDAFKADLDQHAKDIYEAAKKLQQFVVDIKDEGRTVKKGDLAAIISMVNGLTQNIGSNLPHILQVFEEQMEEIVSDAKQEFRAFSQAYVNDLGLQALSQQGRGPVQLEPSRDENDGK